jgi:methylated-DNA-[protein]-cysteine S-methyltransferase
MSENNPYQAMIAAPFGGRIGIVMTNRLVSALDYLPTDTPEQSPIDAATAAVVAELAAYFRDAHTPLTVPVMRAGTPFQHRVWAALQAIPPGTVLTYGELARQLGTAARAIGNACRSNPVPILIPCHRVVARQGLGGYTGAVSGDPLAIKRWLLRHEGVAMACG